MSNVPVYLRIEGKAQMIQRLPLEEAEKLVTLRRLKPVRGRRGRRCVGHTTLSTTCSGMGVIPVCRFG